MRILHIDRSGSATYKERGETTHKEEDERREIITQEGRRNDNAEAQPTAKELAKESFRDRYDAIYDGTESIGKKRNGAQEL